MTDMGPREPDNSMVICPNCTCQFGAISMDDQRVRRELLSALEKARIDGLPCDAWDSRCTQYQIQRDEARAEVERLRAALRGIAGQSAADYEDPEAECYATRALAREALDPDQPKTALPAAGETSTEPSHEGSGPSTGRAAPTAFEVEQDLLLDLRAYGSCYWKIVDGKKVRIHPQDIRIGRDGVPRDSTNTAASSLSSQTSGGT